MVCSFFKALKAQDAKVFLHKLFLRDNPQEADSSVENTVREILAKVQK